MNSSDNGRAAAPESADHRLEAIVARFQEPLRSFFRKRAFDRQEADDLVQEVFCRLAARSESQPMDKPEAYVFQAAANLLRDRARRDPFPSMPLGEGSVDWPAVLGELRQRSFAGWGVLATPAQPDPIVAARRGVDFVKTVLADCHPTVDFNLATP